ncbi:MAG: hypothetical protein LBV65_04450 [Desulfovibrio sp.]|nr:hypothetical protein [Desulfovibrio sp.]
MCNATRLPMLCLVALLLVTLLLGACGQNARVQARGQSTVSVGVGSR